MATKFGLLRVPLKLVKNRTGITLLALPLPQGYAPTKSKSLTEINIDRRFAKSLR
jgi:hypothetical protein